MMRILVTGANGQLGSELRELSKLSNHHFEFTDVQELDLLSYERIQLHLEENETDIIINCAAYTAVDKAEDDVEMARKVNAEAVNNLVRASILKGIKLIHVSTDYVFDGKHHKPLLETEQVSPIGVYGLTKREGEDYILNSDVQGIVIRTSWLYSSFGNNFVKTMLKLGKDREELRVIFDQIGTPTYARDLAESIIRIIEAGDIVGKSKVYHYSNEGVASWYDFAVAIMDVANLKCKVLPIETKDYPTPAERPFYSVMNKGKIKHDFKIEIPYWRESLRECINTIQEETIR